MNDDIERKMGVLLGFPLGRVNAGKEGRLSVLLGSESGNGTERCGVEALALKGHDKLVMRSGTTWLRGCLLDRFEALERVRTDFGRVVNCARRGRTGISGDRNVRHLFQAKIGESLR